MDIDSLENQLATAISSIQLEKTTANNSNLESSPRDSIKVNNSLISPGTTTSKLITSNSKSSSLTGSTSGVYQSSVSDVVSTYSLVIRE